MSTVFERYLLAKLVERERERPGVKTDLRKFSQEVGCSGRREAMVTTSTLHGLVGKGLVSISGLHGRFVRSTPDGRLLAELHGNTTGENIDVSASLPKPTKTLAQSLLEASGKMRSGTSAGAGAPKAAAKAKATPKATPKAKSAPKAPQRSMADQLSSLEPEVSQRRGRSSRVHSAPTGAVESRVSATRPVAPPVTPAPPVPAEPVLTPVPVTDATPAPATDATVPAPATLSEWAATADDLDSAEVLETPLAKADSLPPRGLLRATPEDRLAVLSYALENLNPELELMVLIAREKGTPAAAREALKLAGIARSLSNLWEDLGAEIAATESHRLAVGE